MKKLLLLPLIAINLLATAQTTLIPDANFEQALINAWVDDSLDGQVLTANINTIEFLNVAFRNISDLTGIEDFTALTDLSCNDNNLTSLDVTQNTALEVLAAYRNQLTSVDISQNTALISIWCGENSITNLDVTQNANLVGLHCPDNNLTSLDVTQNTDLNTFICNNNQITSLDVTQNDTLAHLRCNNNLLTSLDVTQNDKLSRLYCDTNQLTSLDVSRNPLLTILDCQQNQLMCLNIAHDGNGIYLNATNNLNLACIEVNDTVPSWVFSTWEADLTASFSTNCSNSCSSTSTGIKERKSITIELYPNPTTSSITLNNLQLGDEVSVYNTLGQRVFNNKVSAVTLSINLSELGNNGIYFVRVNNLSERVLLGR